MANPVVHFEINGPNAEQTAKFYSELFGWHTQTVSEMNYTVVDTHAGEGINGGFGQIDDAYVTFYAEVADLQATLDKAASLGGQTVMPVTEVPVTEVPGIVSMAQFADPEGNVIGIVAGPDETDQGGVSAGDNPAVGWFEVLAADPKAAWSFYRELFGWKINETSGESFVYGEVEAGGRGIPGGIGSSPDGRPHVNLYAAVDDLQRYLDIASSLGATTLMPPMDVSKETSIALFADPQGTTFGLYRHVH